MNALSADIKEIIASGTLIFGTNLFIGKEPSSPDLCVTIYDTGGGAQNPKFAIDESMVQVRARGTSYLETYARLDAIRTALAGKLPLTLTGDAKLIGIWASSSIASLGVDDLDRTILTVNFRAIRELTAGAGNRTILT